MNILALNSGSSSVKFGLYKVDLHGEGGRLQATELFSQSIEQQTQSGTTHSDLFSRINLALASSHLAPPCAIGHRVVHGGKKLLQHCLIDKAVIDQLEEAAELSPVHAGSSLKLIRQAQNQFPAIPQIACFDTAFHSTLPDVARTLPIPHKFQQQGIHRFGFHGLSCESIIGQLQWEAINESAPFPSRLVIAHLGNGVSVTAVKDGKSIDNSMGLTPSGGVIMGTRSGDIDPGLLFHLMRTGRLDVDAMERAINFQSGLLGISGFSSDMRRLHEAAELIVHPSYKAARLAIAMFCYSLRKQIAGMIAALEGIDTLVFTGGIGENDSPVRATICDGLGWVKTGSAPLAVKVLPSQEEHQIAKCVFEVLKHPLQIK